MEPFSFLFFFSQLKVTSVSHFKPKKVQGGKPHRCAKKISSLVVGIETVRLGFFFFFGYCPLETFTQIFYHLASTIFLFVVGAFERACGLKNKKN